MDINWTNMVDPVSRDVPRLGSSHDRINFHPPKNLPPHNCSSTEPDELEFVMNEVILVEEREDDNWLRGYIQHQPHRSGYFPENHTEKMEKWDL